MSIEMCVENFLSIFVVKKDREGRKGRCKEMWNKKILSGIFFFVIFY